jgi:hypothetical protein
VVRVHRGPPPFTRCWHRGLGWLLVADSGASNAQPIKASIFLLIAAGAGIYLVIKATRLLLDIMGGSVLSRTGRLEMVTKVSDWDWLWPWESPKWMVCKYRFDPSSDKSASDVIDRFAQEMGMRKEDLYTTRRRSKCDVSTSDFAPPPTKHCTPLSSVYRRAQVTSFQSSLRVRCITRRVSSVWSRSISNSLDSPLNCV